MKKILTVLVLLAAAGSGAYYYSANSKTQAKPQVTQIAVSRGEIQEVVQATGTLQSLRNVQVGSQVSGTVKAMHVDFNSIVTKGQLLAELDPTLLQVQVDLQTANVERQKGEIASQEVQLEDAKKQLERTRAMAERGLATEQQLDQATLTVKTRTTSVDAARKQLVTNEANLAQAKLNVDYTKIYAPIDGVVLNRIVDVGQTVQASMSTPQFLTLAYDLRNLKLTAMVDEAEIGRVQRGMPVTFTVDSYQGTTFSGTVEAVRLNAQNNNNVVTYPVWINAPNPDLKLRPSMTANLRIVISTATDVLRVPNMALRFRPTNDMYTALGLKPPTVGSGRTSGAAPQTTTASSGGAAAGGAPIPAADTRPADQGERQREQPAGERMMVAGEGNRGRGGQDGLQRADPDATPVALNAEKIDDLFTPVQARITPGTIWTWDEAEKTLTPKRISIGINDGQFSQVVNGDLKAGEQIVSNIVVPITEAQRAQRQSIFGQQQRGGGQGFGPAPANGNFGGGGNAGGGQRGGGGGGRGGGF